MADDPVGTAASTNPVLTTLVTAVSRRRPGRHPELRRGPHGLRPHRLRLRRTRPRHPRGRAGRPDRSADHGPRLPRHRRRAHRVRRPVRRRTTTFTGETLDRRRRPTVGGQATIVVPDIQTANATVHLIDTVMLPPSVTGAAARPTRWRPMRWPLPTPPTICDADAIVAAVEGGDEEGTLAGMADDPVGHRRLLQPRPDHPGHRGLRRRPGRHPQLRRGPHGLRPHRLRLRRTRPRHPRGCPG